MKLKKFWRSATTTGAGATVAIGGKSAALGIAGLGHASTGTAISSLSGVAATSAKLAWLGGGSLAAGGFGVAGGTAVLTALPFVGVPVAGVGIYKMAKKLFF